MFDDHSGATGNDPDDGLGGHRVRYTMVEDIRLLAGWTPLDDQHAFDLEPVLTDLSTATAWDVHAASDDELCALALGLENARRHIDALSLHALAELDARGVTDSEHGLVTGSWLANQAQLPTAASKARVKLARKLRGSLPEVDEALSEGRISFEHARVLADAANPRILDDFTVVVGHLIDSASRLSFDRWKREVTALADLLDADGGHRPGDDINDNTLRLRRGLGGTLHLEGQLCGEYALIADQVLNAKADELFRRYRNDENLTPDLRVPARHTLMALALFELCRDTQAKDANTSTPARPEVALIVNATDPTVVTTGEGVRIGDTERDTLLCDPVFRTVVMGVHGVVVEMGRDQRLVNPDQRRALNHRDGGCVFPGCDRPANWTDAHHVWHWLHGGPTDLSLLASLCRHHHGVSHRSGWNMYVTDDEWFWWQTRSGHTFWSQRHGHQREGPTPDPATCTNATGPPHTRCTDPPDTT